ncbi:MAG: GTPase HflX [Oscillospiraceae bacterium]|jgi:GTP-binding protein HflX|nr:GTPase HflX [Oscillospiraceae bacterium]
MTEKSSENIAVLAGIDTGGYDADASMDELRELAKTAGVETAAFLIQKRPSPDPATVLGGGKIEEVKGLCDAFEADLVIFDTELTAVQIRNIEKITERRVIDRTTLILDIFARRAVSGEGKLQVELAQLKYRFSRLGGLGTSLSRLGGGIGTRGPGETRLETDRRHIRRRIGKLTAELEELTARRDFSRRRRKKDGVLTGAIVGYTNAGKSTLLNALTGAGVAARDKLFATLDPTMRGVELPDGRNLVLVDTVGLLRRLPHKLVEAFKSTLEEAANADIILHVRDVSDPEADEKARVAGEILAELGAGGIPTVNVLNKCDIAENNLPENENTVKISAKNGEGLLRLLEVTAANLPGGGKRVKLLLPFDKAGEAAKIRANGKVFSEEYTARGLAIDALVEEKLLKSLKGYEL